MGALKSKPKRIHDTNDIREVLDTLDKLRTTEPKEALEICNKLSFNPVVDSSSRFKRNVERLKKRYTVLIAATPALEPETPQAESKENTVSDSDDLDSIPPPPAEEPMQAEILSNL